MTVAEARQQRAEVLAQGAAHWLLVTTRSGEQRIGIPSQIHAGKYHLARLDPDRCSCRDATYRSGACKHVLSLRLVARQFGLLPDERTASRRNGHVKEHLNGYAF